PIEVRTDGRLWIVGTGDEPLGDPATAIAVAIATPEPDEKDVSLTPVGRVTTEPFELFRALTGRRSAAQIRRFDWTIPPEPYVALFDLWPFTIRPTDLVE